MDIKKNDTYEYRKVVKRPDLRVSLLEIGFCTEKVLFKELKKPFNGRLYLTTDTNKFYFDWNDKRREMDVYGESIPDISGYAKKSDIPTKTSQLKNDSGFLTTESVGDFLRNNGYVTEEMLADEIANIITDDELGADVSVDNGELSVSNENGIVLGKDIVEFKKYADTKDVDVTNSNGDSDAIKLTKTINDGKNVFDINIVWSEYN